MSRHDADEYLRRVIRLSEEMIELAHAGDAIRTDPGCGVVFGTLRDKAYKVRKLAQSELDRHRSAAEPRHDTDLQTPQSEGERDHE